MANAKLDNVKYKIINVMNDINAELIRIRELTEQLNYIWLEVEKINESIKD